jgi:hypothetical protein
MKNKRLTWFLFLLVGWIILVINGCRSKKIHLSFINELRELCKKHSIYLEDGDYRLIHKSWLDSFKKRKR